MNPLEDNRVEGQEKVEQTVHERHVDAEGEHDWLGNEHSHWAAQVFLDEFAEVNLDFFLFGVNAPILSATTQLRGLIDEDHRRISLFKEDKAETESKEAHNCCDVFCPAPAEVRHVDESTNKGR